MCIRDSPQIAEFINTFNTFYSTILSHSYLHPFLCYFPSRFLTSTCRTFKCHFLLQSSLYTTTLFVDPFLAKCTSYGITSNSFLTNSTGPLTRAPRHTDPNVTFHYLRFIHIYSHSLSFQVLLPTTQLIHQLLL